MYTQHDEEMFILHFFKDKENGRLLEIGAYHPEVFSNSRALILKGWEAVLVEGSPMCVKPIKDFYEDEPKVKVYETLLNDYDGEMVFYDSAGAIATGSIEHYERWKNYQGDYKKITLPCLSWNSFYNYIFQPKFDFISIDVEGMDAKVLCQIDFDKTETSLVCVEYTYDLAEIMKHLAEYEFEIIHMNGENIIAGR